MSYPKRLWARDALASEGLSPSLRAALAKLAEEHDVVTRLVAHEGKWSGRVELSFFPQRRRHHDVPLDDVAALLDTAEPDDGEVITTPVIACCTHGVRDACCARFGMELVRALRESALASGAEVEIREASHLGGDRFAPTVLVLPSGHMYGHLEASDADELVAAARGAAPLAPRFRGSLWLDPLEQLAEVAALELARERGVTLRGELGKIERTDEGDRHATLRCTATVGEEAVDLEVRCALEHRLVVGDCRSATSGRRGNVRVWVIDGVSAVKAVIS